MEFNQKLQELRKQKGLTQEELAKTLYVSRTAVSKWESGRGYPSIDSLKEIAKYFSITVDELLSSNEILTIAENDNKQKSNRLCNLIYSLLDISFCLLLLLPFFGEKVDGNIKSVSLIYLNKAKLYLKIAYFTSIILTVSTGIITLALQNFQNNFWLKSKSIISLLLNILSVLIFTISLQPYPAVFTFVLLIIKILTLIKTQ